MNDLSCSKSIPIQLALKRKPIPNFSLREVLIPWVASLLGEEATLFSPGGFSPAPKCVSVGMLDEKGGSGVVADPLCPLKLLIPMLDANDAILEAIDETELTDVDCSSSSVDLS